MPWQDHAGADVGLNCRAHAAGFDASACRAISGATIRENLEALRARLYGIQMRAWGLNTAHTNQNWLALTTACRRLPVSGPSTPNGHNAGWCVNARCGADFPGRSDLAAG